MSSLQVSGLISLSLAFCDRMEDEGVEALSTLTTLTELDLTYCRAVTDRGVAALHMLTRLQTLKLQGCGARAPHMGGGLSVLRGMGQLQALTLAGATVTQVCRCCVCFTCCNAAAFPQHTRLDEKGWVLHCASSVCAWCPCRRAWQPCQRWPA